LSGVIVVDVLWKYAVTQNVLVQELFDAIALVSQPAPVQAVASMLGPHCSSILSLPTHFTECFRHIHTCKYTSTWLLMVAPSWIQVWFMMSSY